MTWVVRAVTRGRCLQLLATLALGAFLGAGLASRAAAAGCPEANPTYTSSCGPEFVTPAWGDAAGWNEPSHYSTIQLADVNGDGKDELIGRAADGLEIWEFDTKLGQWRPQVNAQGQPQVLRDFHSPVPGQPGPNWDQPQYYSTIQAVSLDGGPAKEILARFPDGMRVYKYFPPPGTDNINGGTWKVISKDGPFSDADGYTDPSLYLTIHTGVVDPSIDPNVDLFARSHAGLVAYGWNGSGWTAQPTVGGQDVVSKFDDANCSQPACYLEFRTAEVCNGCGVDQDVLVARTPAGIDTIKYETGNFVAGNGGFWNWWSGSDDGGSENNPADMFADTGGPDCPFARSDPTGPAPGLDDCFGDSPAYYETLRVADVDGGQYYGQPSEDLLGRASDGLRVKKFLGPPSYTWTALPTLTDLAGSSTEWASTPGRWGSIRTGDILGNGRDQVLALDGQGLQAWSYNPSGQTTGSWSKLASATPLSLTGDWLTNPSYYSTIQVGDITGDGHDAVIARGPYGIRTLFYCSGGTSSVPGCASLPGKTGWTGFAPQGYPQFATSGQQAAFAALNALAKSQGVIPLSAQTIRDVWTGENAPQSADLTRLQQNLVSLAGCTGLINGSPPSYQTCTPPSGSNGFSAADWTAVVNEMLSEIFDAQQVVAQFTQLDQLRQRIFIGQGAELPAIGSALQLPGAAGDTAAFNLQGFFSSVIGIAGSIAGVSGPEAAPAAAALAVASYLLSMLPSASPTANSTYQTTYGGLQAEFATIVQETDKALDVQSQEVRQDLALLSLVAQLRVRGTWSFDSIGIQSAANEAFTTWAYQALLPTIYSRYVVTNCTTQGGNASYECETLPSGPGVIGGGPGATSASWIGPSDDNPCQAGIPIICQYQYTPGALPANVANTVWGTIPATCNYQPGNAATVWTFGCPLGFLTSTIAQGGEAYGLQFTTCVGSPVIAIPSQVGTCSAPTGTANPGGDGAIQLTATAGASKGFNVQNATFTAPGLLASTGKRGKTAKARTATAPTTIHLSLSHGKQLLPGGGIELGTPAGAPPATLTLTRQHGQPRLQFSVSRVAIVTPKACQELPAAISLTTRQFNVTASLRLSDGHHTRSITLPTTWRCVRNGSGAITKLTTVRSIAPAQRPGLRLSIRGPGAVVPGSTITYTVRLRNTRHGHQDRTITSLWNLRAVLGVIPTRVSGQPQVGYRVTPVVSHLRELRQGRTRTLRIAVHIPAALAHALRGRVCITALATADAARAASARACPLVSGPPPGRG